jgi:hypothetical protein
VSGLVQRKVRVGTIDSDSPLIDSDTCPFTIIMTQDCDLDSDFYARQGERSSHKILPNILFCEMTPLEHLREQARQTGAVMGSDAWGRVRKNQVERYHALEQISPGEDLLGQGLPELGIDFKRYFTIPTDEVYDRLAHGEFQRRCRLRSPYLEHLSTRFAYFLYRVALPEELTPGR